MAGDYITCPDCKGWPSCETGMLCLTCGDDGVVWDEYPDDEPEGYEVTNDTLLPATPSDAP